MKLSGMRLGRLFGIEISLELGVIPLVAILNVLLASSILPQTVPGHVGLTYWTVAFLISVLFVVSLLAHELAHSLVARRLGIGVKGVVLWLFGGVSELESEPRTPGAEFLIAVVGPLVSILGGVGALGASWGLNAVGGPDIYVTAIAWLGIVNVILGVFNLLPGIPLDGGRVLAAVIWKVRGNRTKGQLASALVGRLLGLGLAGFGVYEIVVNGTWLGIWNVGLGLMLHQAAKYQERLLRLEEGLGETTVDELMDSQPRSASSLSTVSQAVASALESGHQSAVPVLGWNGELIAVVELSELYAVPRAEWETTAVLTVVPDGSHPVVASPTDRVADLMLKMTTQRRSHAAVMEGGRFVGLIGPEQILTAASRQ